jgi:hypothetical protein
LPGKKTKENQKMDAEVQAKVCSESISPIPAATLGTQSVPVTLSRAFLVVRVGQRPVKRRGFRYGQPHIVVYARWIQQKRVVLPQTELERGGKLRLVGRLISVSVALDFLRNPIGFARTLLFEPEQARTFDPKTAGVF